MDVRPMGGGPPADAELVRQARGGRRAAFDELIERYQRRATSVAYRLLGNLHDALEVCQEAFVRAYHGLATLEHDDRFGAWLLRIVTNLALNHRRARRLRKTHQNGALAEGPGDDAEPLSSDARPGADLVAAELAERIRIGLQRLPAQQRAALVLFSIEGLPQRQVAEILGCSVEAVKWHVFQARRKLREFLAELLR